DALLRTLHILLQLLDKLLRSGKWSGVAQSLHKINRQRLAIEVSFEANQVDLDLACLLAKRGIGADVRGAGPACLSCRLTRRGGLNLHCVNAICWNQRGDVFQVRGRKPERLPAALANPNRAVQPKKAAQ